MRQPTTTRTRLSNFFKRLIPGKPASRRTSHATETAEVLEDRTLLAGNVLAKMSGSGNLIIKGDNASNRVDIIPVAGGVSVQGLLDVNNIPTTVNGANFAFFAGPTFIRGNLKLVMKGGDDGVGIGTNVEKNVVANMGSGSDGVLALNIVIGGNAKINLGSSSDLVPGAVIANNVGVLGNATIKGGDGIHQIFLVNSAVAKKLTVNLGSGNDYLGIQGGAEPASYNLNGGSGFDTLELIPFGGGVLPSKNFEIFI